jgi:heterodisulfide reductase subunit C
MTLTALLNIALGFFVIGMAYRLCTWFSRKPGYWGRDHSISERAAGAAKGIAGALFSSRLPALAKALVLDVFLQRKIFRESLTRWLMHVLIFWGFLLLLLTHALGKIVLPPLFGEYVPTRNPYFFLRDFLGLLVLVGLSVAAWRRYIGRVPRLKSSGMDLYAIVILAVIMVSGILLAGLKIASYSVFDQMVKDYSTIEDDEEVKALESVWVKEFGLVSSSVEAPFPEERLEAGWELHDANCAGCHASAKWSFSAYSAAKAAGPALSFMDRAGGVRILWYIHILSCLFALAYLPFSKMLHIVAAPVSLLVTAARGESPSAPVGALNTVTRQAVELDACTHCGTCSYYCSAMMASEATGNDCILPSEKMGILKRFAAGKRLFPEEMHSLQEGVCLCTNCDRCTVVCPSGIDLKELWRSVREGLIQQGTAEPLMLSPFSLLRGLLHADFDPSEYNRPVDTAHKAAAGRFHAFMDPERSLPLDEAVPEKTVSDPTFAHCFGCRTCTTVCPVVENYESPQKVLGLLPHQIMYMLALGQEEAASGAQMIWDCVTCYQCQEHCPQNVRVTEVLFGLKNRAISNMKGAEREEHEVEKLRSLEV